MKKERVLGKNALENGAPCLRHQCVLCCVGTEMPLSRSDINRIRRLGYELRAFTVKSQSGWQLKNQFGRCVLLSSSGCEIYAHRPEGCRLYPLVFDEESGRCVKDDVCPYFEEFKVTEDDERRLRLFLQRLKREATQ